jgi:hypothetical protein
MKAAFSVCTFRHYSIIQTVVTDRFVLTTDVVGQPEVLAGQWDLATPEEHFADWWPGNFREREGRDDSTYIWQG